MRRKYLLVAGAALALLVGTGLVPVANAAEQSSITAAASAQQGPEMYAAITMQECAAVGVTRVYFMGFVPVIPPSTKKRNNDPRYSAFIRDARGEGYNARKERVPEVEILTTATNHHVKGRFETWSADQRA